MQPSQALAHTPLHGLQERHFQDTGLPLVTNGFNLNNGLCHKSSEALGSPPGVLKQLEALLLVDKWVHAPERSHPRWLPAHRSGPVPCPEGGWGHPTKYNGAFNCSFWFRASRTRPPHAGAKCVRRAHAQDEQSWPASQPQSQLVGDGASQAG